MFHQDQKARNGATVLHDRRSTFLKSRSLRQDASTFEEPAVAPRAGADLREARERLSWLLEDVAAQLRIQFRYLNALEEGRISLLPAKAYAIGFLRTYAVALGLDPDEMVRRFRAEAAEVSEKTELAFPAPVPEKGLPTGAIMLLGIVLVVALYVGWYRLSGEGRLPAEAVMPIPEKLAPLVEQAVPARGPTSVQQAAVIAAEPAPVLERSTVAPPISPSSAAAAPVQPLVTTIKEATSVAPEPPSLALRANADSWIQVRDPSGALLMNRILRAGEEWPVPDRANLLLTTGNAGGTEVWVNGVLSGNLGNSGAVRRDLPLDVESVKTGKLIAPPGAARPRQ